MTSRSRLMTGHSVQPVAFRWSLADRKPRKKIIVPEAILPPRNMWIRPNTPKTKQRQAAVNVAMVLSNPFHDELSPKRYWRGPKSQAVEQEGRLYLTVTLHSHHQNDSASELRQCV